jgi:hypothetical protein
MNIYTCTTFTGHWPVGTAAVVQAETQAEAAELLQDALSEAGLPQDVHPEQMELLQVPALILNDGDY